MWLNSFSSNWRKFQSSNISVSTHARAVYKKFACYLLNYLLMFQFLISSSFHSSLNGLWLAITNHNFFVMMMLDVNILFYFHAKIKWTILKLKLASWLIMIVAEINEFLKNCGGSSCDFFLQLTLIVI